MVNAFRAGTIVAVWPRAVGWFMVLRRQSFAGHTLAVVSFPGAAGAIWLGISATLGYFAASIAAALVIAMVPRSTIGARPQPGVRGDRHRAGLRARLRCPLRQPLRRIPQQPDRPPLRDLPRHLRPPGGHAAWWRCRCWSALAGMARPLLFATVDPDVATARRVPVRWLSVAFLVLLGLRRRRGQPDHRGVAGVRPAGHAGGRRPAAHRPSRPQLRADRRPGPGHHLARARGGLLLRLSGRVLRDHVRVRGLCAGRRGTGRSPPTSDAGHRPGSSLHSEVAVGA